jgi:hypothetical protein
MDTGELAAILRDARKNALLRMRTARGFAPYSSTKVAVSGMPAREVR